MTTKTPGFQAETTDLDYNFEPYVEGAKGSIPEPSSRQVEALIEFLREVLPTKEGADGKTTLDLARLAERFEGKDSEEVEMLVNTAISDVTSGEIKPETIKALPYRVKQRFYGWLLGTLLSPEA